MNEKSTQRELVNRKRFNTSVDKQLLENLNKLSKETLIPKSKLIDRALELLFDEYSKILDVRIISGNKVITSSKKDFLIIKKTKI